MSVERAAGGTSLIDVLDRVLDKGIVIDAWVRVSPVGIDLITVEARVVVASLGLLAPDSRPATRFGSVASSRSALRRVDDDDDGGPDMPNEQARALAYALTTAVVLRIKDHFALARDLDETLSLSNPSDSAHQRFDGEDSPDLSDELQFLSAFIAVHAANVAFASNPQHRSEVLREFRTQYLELQDEKDRSHLGALLEDRFRRYETALSTCRADEREDDVLARAFADVCGRNEFDFCSVASDIVAQELIVMRGVVRHP